MAADDDERPPVFRRWRDWYLLVALTLAALVTGFSIWSRVFQ